MKAGAGKAGAGKAAAVPPMKRSAPWFQEEVTSSSSSDIGPPPGFSGNPIPASMMNKGKDKAGAGMLGTGKAAALVTPKKEVTSSGRATSGRRRASKARRSTMECRRRGIRGRGSQR